MAPIDEVVKLLKQIADHTAHDNSTWIAFISGGSGVLGAAVVAVTNYFQGRKNAASQERVEKSRLHANLVTTERLRWLQDIRTRLSHLYMQMDLQYNHLKRPLQGQPSEFQDKLDILSSDVIEQTHFITLMLNPGKPDQLALRNALSGAQVFIVDCFAGRNCGQLSFDDKRYAALKQAAFDALTSIGLQTWERIKALQ